LPHQDVASEVAVADQRSPREVLDSIGDKLFASVPESAVILRSDPRSVRRAVAAGVIPAVRVGPRLLVPVEWLREMAGVGGR
jgi:hypothetical protein